MTVDFERMLIETVTMMESSNLMELLPVEVEAWWGQRKLEEEQELESDRSEAMKFVEQRLKHWKQQQVAASLDRAGEE
jgi:hypothetical protein